MQIFICPQATPGAPGIASGYAPGQIKICIFPQATPKAFYCTIFDLRGYAWGYASGTLGVASGYAPGQIKICIFPQGTPKAFYCTIFAFREICKFSFPLRLPPGHCLRYFFRKF
ncbi:hypothetical protein T03_4957 [Trichinella britovi]|uniref:Uncharacterized protein n=1 Tax=Trichinella britovi TaxID=45882 RepID=A0A0V1CJT1_TRIBR|nr:hypothetical protein T03_4957 [Trichinella britovi]